MDRYIIDVNDKNVRKAMAFAHQQQRRTGIPTRYFPAVKTKHVEKNES